MLAGFLARARANGVENMRQLTRVETLALEPALRAEGALLSPETGISDSHGLTLAYQGEAKDHGAMIAFDTPATGGEAAADGVVIEPPEMRLKARTVVNCAALSAVAVASRLRGFPAAHLPRLTLAKGSYFSRGGATPFSPLIYPARSERFYAAIRRDWPDLVARAGGTARRAGRGGLIRP